jgi:hypothetical protein
MMMRTSLFMSLMLASLAARAVAADEPAPAAVVSALAASTTIPDARVTVTSVERGHGACTSVERVEVPRPVDGSGRFAVKLIGARASGEPCESWSWVRVRLFAKVPVVTRAVRAGDSLAGAVKTEEREIQPGHVPASVAADASADRSLGAGQMLEADAVRAPGLRPGEAVKVVLVSGGLAVEQTGRAVPCARNHTCAVLPSGKHVDGALVEGRLMVQLP